MRFSKTKDVIKEISVALTSYEKKPVVEGAKKLVIYQPGRATTNWNSDETPYMVEPANVLGDRLHDTVCFVGPARSGKTICLLEGWFTHTTLYDPGDFLILQMSQAKALEFSKTRIARAIRYTLELNALLHNSNGIYDSVTHKFFKNGASLTIGWPVVSQVSSIDYRYVALTDYDRMPEDLDGEGAPYDLAVKRITTFLSRGKCAVESSPGRLVLTGNWVKATKHEAPPTTGILSIYNRGDRRRWYWPCEDCNTYFEAAPGLSLFGTLPDDDALLDLVRQEDLVKLAKEHCSIVCPNCGVVIPPSRKKSLNRSGIWLRDGEIYGEPETGAVSNIASFWLGGVAAAYQTWESLLTKYFQALKDYATSSSEFALQAVCNTDFAIPYMPRSVESVKDLNNSSRLAQDYKRYYVPEDGRYIIASIDVQAGKTSSFVVQVHAYGSDNRSWLIDRYTIVKTLEDERVDTENPKHWDILTDKVIKSTYKTVIPNTELRLAMVVLDSGHLTVNAYAWYNRLRAKGLHSIVRLYKGALPSAPLMSFKMYGTGVKDIPALYCNSNIMKDTVFNAIVRDDGIGKIHIPKWLGSFFWDELKSETKIKGVWTKTNKKHNEALDLCCMNMFGNLALGGDKINWAAPPAWARPMDTNILAISSDGRRLLKTKGTLDGSVNKIKKPNSDFTFRGLYDDLS